MHLYLSLCTFTNIPKALFSYEKYSEYFISFSRASQNAFLLFLLLIFPFWIINVIQIQTLLV